MNRKNNPKLTNRNQRGAGTLFVVLVMLLLSSLVIFFTTRNAINEQRLSANEIRSKQAYDAASAGLDIALSYFSQSGQTLTKLNPVTMANSAVYQVTFCSPSWYATHDLPTCPPKSTGTLDCDHHPDTGSESRTPIVVACGWSDDSEAVARHIQKASGTPSLAGDVTSPVVSRATTNLLTGGASIFNYFNDLTIWSGKDVPIQSNTGKSFIRNVATDPSATSSDYRTTGNSPGCNNPPTHYTCSTDGISLGPDVIPQDSLLTSMSTDEFFANFMGKEPTTYRDTVATDIITSAQTGTLNGKTDAVIWVDGDTSGLGTIGTQTNPVILVINGDLDLSSNTVINGLVFVTGKVTANGTPTIYGALISTGDVNATGNMKVIYDPKVLGKLTLLGRSAYVPGSWRDW